jgi:hypothetical protein
MKFVSAEWVDDADGGKAIKATGDDGKEYWIGSVASDVPPWPEYMEAVRAGEKTIAGDPPEEK